MKGKVNLDSLRQANTPPQTFGVPTGVDPEIQQRRDSVEFSESALDAAIDYSARDSMRIDAKNKKIFLFGGGDITYTGINLKADFIEFDWGNNIVTASGLTDTTGRTTGKPVFTDGTETFNAGRIRYNFKTQKGLITDASSVQQNLYVLGKRTKYISSGGDTTKSDVIYNRNAIFTTCNLDHPHYGVRSNKQKVIPNKLVVIGPSNVEVSGIPTPLWLPFGFFPISTGAQTGLIFPKGYEFDPRWGFGLEEVGWFFPVNDYVNFTATGDVFVKGTFKLKGRMNYRRRYKYNGNFFMEYANFNNETNDGTRVRDRAFILALNHKQDNKANPFRTFGGSINFQTNNALSKSYNDAQSVLTNTIKSNFSYNERFPGKPMTLSVGLSHSQNTNTREVTVSAPTVNFRLQRVYPFKRKNPIGGKKWYEDIAVDYVGEARNRVVGTDTTFFDSETWRNAQYGARHKSSLSTKFTALKYFNVTPNVNYEEIWFFKTLEKEFDPTIVVEEKEENGLTILDTLSRGTVTDTLVNGFTPYRKFDMNATVNTKLFGTVLFKKGKLRGVRHVVTPSVGFTYTPDQSQYYKTVPTDATDPDAFDEYNIFRGGVYGATPQQGERMSLNYSIGNQVEAKLFSKKDSTTRNVTILRNLSIGGNYNFAADTLNFSQVRASTAARLFNGITNITVSATFDPYQENENGRRINTFYWRSNGKPLRFDQLTTSIQSSITVKKLKEIFTGKRDKDEDPGAPPPRDREVLNEQGNFDFDLLGEEPLSPEEEELEREKQLAEEEKEKQELDVRESIINLFEGFSMNHAYRFRVDRVSGTDTLITTAHTISVRGDIQLTERWRFTGLSFGYDFSSKRITYPQIGIARSLHCWELGGSWQPQRGTFSFFLRVKPGSSLDFLSVPYRRTPPPTSVFD